VVAEHGWCYLNAAIDCCTREIAGWALDVRCRAPEAVAVVDRAFAERGIGPDRLTLGTDNGSAFTSRTFRGRLAEHGIAPRRGGDRDPESQAFIESWFASKQRCIWREEFEILDEARHVIGNYVERYHHRPPPGPRLPHPGRRRRYLEGSTRPVNPSGITVKRRRGPRHRLRTAGGRTTSSS
jgi:putative transposase